MSNIQITDLTFAYPGSHDNIFEHVSFSLDTDWRLGFTGRNGRGKTTFLRLLMGQYDYKGTITASVSFDYFPYEGYDKTAMTHDILTELRPEAAEWEIRRELSLLDVCEDILWRPFDTLSGGEQVKALLAALFLGNERFLLIDEPTNHLDKEARESIASYLSRKKGFILVSHDRRLLDRCTDHTLVLRKTAVEVQSSSFSVWWDSMQKREKNEAARNEKLKKDILRLEKSAAQTAAWSDKTEKSKSAENAGLKPDRGYVGHKAAKLMKRAGAIEARKEAAIREKSALLQNTEETESLQIHPLDFHSERLIQFSDVSLLYGKSAACEGISFTIRRGDRIALQGKNGCGKSSILKFIQGDIALTCKGNYYQASGLKISYVSQDTSDLCGSLSEYERRYDVDGVLLRAILSKLGFSRVQFEKDIKTYSEGQKKKLSLARSLCEKAHLYLWDEPLNYIDVFSRMQMEELLLTYRPTMLFVEHDAAFTENIATDIISLSS